MSAEAAKAARARKDNHLRANIVQVELSIDVSRSPPGSNMNIQGINIPFRNCENITVTVRQLYSCRELPGKP